MAASRSTSRVKMNQPPDVGIRAGDLITAIDDAPVRGLDIGQVVDKLRGATNSQVRLKIRRAGMEQPIDLVVTRAIVYRPPVALRVRTDAGKLMAEAIGTWPILDFEKGKAVALTAASNDEFYVDGADHTRVVFVRDATAKVLAAILNPGPWQQRGERY